METKTLANPLLFQGIATQPKASACERGENRLALDPLVVPGEDDLTHESGVGGLEPVEPPKDAAEPHDTAFAPDPGDLERLRLQRHAAESYVADGCPGAHVALPKVRILVVGSLLALAFASPAGAFDLGLASGDIRPTSAVVWTRADRPGPVQLFYWQVYGGGASTGLRRMQVRAESRRDLTLRVRLTGLRPSTEYRYSFLQGTTVTRLGTFRTAPAPSSDATVRFAWSGDSDGTIDRRTGKPAFGPFEVLAAAAAAKPAFFAYLGDTIYADSTFGKPAASLADYRAKYRQNRAIAALRTLEQSVPVVAMWDDHEVQNDYDPANVPADLLTAGTRAFREYQPVEAGEGQPLYRSFRWGRHLEVFVLDVRSYRSPSAREACENPAGSGMPDVAPLLPQTVRDGFALAFAQLARPVPDACRTALFDPGRRLLGKTQLNWLQRRLARSSATWKIVLTPDPIQELELSPYDRWEGYQAERSGLLRFIRERRIANVVWLAADTHATLVKDVLLDGDRTGMVEVVTGPIGTRTFGENVSRAAGPTAGALVATFLKSRGARCAVVDRFAYGLVEASRTRLVVRVRDAKGRALCGGPITIRPAGT